MSEMTNERAAEFLKGLGEGWREDHRGNTRFGDEDFEACLIGAAALLSLAALKAASKDFLTHALDHVGECDTCKGAAARLKELLP